MALSSLSVVVSLLLLTSRVLADTCPDRDAIANFDSSAFLGRWYTVKQTALEGNGTLECLNMLVKSAGEQTQRLATHTRFLDHTHTAIHFMLGVLFKEDNSSTDGKYLYSRRISETESNKKYYILDIDFTNFAVTWYCFPSRITGRVTEIYSVLSRQTSLDPELLREAERHLPEGRYMDVSHEHCSRGVRSGSSSSEVLEPDSASLPSAEHA